MTFFDLRQVTCSRSVIFQIEYVQLDAVAWTADDGAAPNVAAVTALATKVAMNVRRIRVIHRT